MDHLRLLGLKDKLLKYITTFAVGTHLTKEQWLQEHLNVKSHMFRAGTPMRTLSRAKGQHLAQIITLININ
jgi:hypothetical protein